MNKFVRKSAWNSGGDFSNQDLLWYAKGVGKMMGRALNDPSSWWFFAAMHGEYVNPNTAWYVSPPSFPDWGYINSPPTVPTTPLPAQATQDKFWNQCQHGSWYFLPWHRGYLMALEEQLRVDIVSLGGPDTWALPYWNYFGGVEGSDAKMPPAFALQTLPDGSPNPLYVAMRYGPNADGNIYIPTQAWDGGNVTDACMLNTLYTGRNQTTPLPGFGGPETTFSHSGRTHGNMERNPHDLVHVYTGGQISDTNYGLMADPGTAALDPIFYLHHCNIDRMWAAWNEEGNANPTKSDWLNGPAKQFVMPMPGGESWVYTPGEMTSLSNLNYTYEDVSAPAKPAVAPLARRLQTLGVAPAAAASNAPSPQPTQAPAELLGASTGAIQLSAASAPPVSVRLDPGVQKLVTQSLKTASNATPPDHVYLKLENVRGALDSTVLGVYINLPSETAAADVLREHHAGDIGLFGLRRASAKHGAHGGDGLTFVLDISHLIDRLYVDKELSSGSIQVSLRPRRGLPGQCTIDVGRLSVYRQPN